MLVQLKRSSRTGSCVESSIVAGAMPAVVIELASRFRV
jgi:hypothetical protein